ncbi:MAG: hypothetical protein ABIK38_00225 [candidate division WOR-3 bacterium]
MPIFTAVFLLTGLISGPGLTRTQTACTAAPRFTDNQASFDMYQDEIVIDTCSIVVLAGAQDSAGNIYALVVTPESILKIYRSSDRGGFWEVMLTMPVPAPVSQAELLIAGTDPAKIFIFLLTTAAGGDLWLMRTTSDFTDRDWLPVAVGPDTIDRFTVTVDNNSRPCLYCLYVREHRTGPNGRFTRSLDLGSTWEPFQDFYNCSQPCLYFGAGTLHCAWCYAIDNRQLHYTRNRHFGAPGRWEPLQVLYATGERCLTPVVVQAETLPPWRAPVWIAWSVARRDTEMLDLLITCSTDGGSTFSTPVNLGEPFIDEWWPSLAATSTTVNLLYNAGAGGENDPTVIYYRYARCYAPQLLSSPLKINDSRANPAVSGARPRALGSGALFSHYGAGTTARGLYFYRLTPRFALQPRTPKPASTTSMILDPAGRRVNLTGSRRKAGVYFLSEGDRWRKLLILR